jgi:hypothetical protein
MFVSIFYANFVWNIIHYKNNSAKYDKNVYWCSCKVPYILARSKENLNFRKILKFHEHPSSGSLVVRRGQTDEERT